MKAKREERNRVIYDLDGSNGDLVRPNHDAEDSIHMQQSNQENERRNYSLFNIDNAWRVPDNPDTEELKLAPLPQLNLNNSQSSISSKSEAYKVIPQENIKIDQCMICLDNLDSPDKQIACLKCDSRHVFHKSCIDEWLKQNSTCPTCRKQVKRSDNSNYDIVDRLLLLNLLMAGLMASTQRLLNLDEDIEALNNSINNDADRVRVIESSQPNQSNEDVNDRQATGQ